jgi:hypothetical protein
MIGRKSGEGVVAYGVFAPRISVAGLERSARLAGEAFGHEEAAPLSRLNGAVLRPPRWLSSLAAALASAAGLLVPGSR